MQTSFASPPAIPLSPLQQARVGLNHSVSCSFLANKDEAIKATLLLLECVMQVTTQLTLLQFCGICRAKMGRDLQGAADGVLYRDLQKPCLQPVRHRARLPAPCCVPAAGGFPLRLSPTLPPFASLSFRSKLLPFWKAVRVSHQAEMDLCPTSASMLSVRPELQPV